MSKRPRSYIDAMERRSWHDRGFGSSGEDDQAPDPVDDRPEAQDQLDRVIEDMDQRGYINRGFGPGGEIGQEAPDPATEGDLLEQLIEAEKEFERGAEADLRSAERDRVRQESAERGDRRRRTKERARQTKATPPRDLTDRELAAERSEAIHAVKAHERRLHSMALAGFGRQVKAAFDLVTEPLRRLAEVLRRPIVSLVPGAQLPARRQAPSGDQVIDRGPSMQAVLAHRSNLRRLCRLDAEIARRAKRERLEAAQRVLTEAVKRYRARPSCPAQWCRAFCAEHGWRLMADGETKLQFEARVRRAGSALDAQECRRRYR
jgi:hypothetical protein